MYCADAEDLQIHIVWFMETAACVVRGRALKAMQCLLACR